MYNEKTMVINMEKQMILKIYKPDYTMNIEEIKVYLSCCKQAWQMPEEDFQKYLLALYRARKLMRMLNRNFLSMQELMDIEVETF